MSLELFGRTLAIAAAALALVAAPAAAEPKSEKAEELVEEAHDTVLYFLDDEPYDSLRNLAADANAMVIIPSQVRGGFIFGGSGGNGLMIARNADGTWSHPHFLTIGSFSFGLQAGGEVSELILLVMTERGKERLLSSTVKVGADLTAAVGPVGGGARVQTADIIAFARSRGVYGGVSIEGAVIKARRDWNEAYYGRRVTGTEIVFGHNGEVSNPQANELRSAVARLGLGLEGVRE